MEELETLLKLIAGLPQMALWVLAGFWAYKVIFVGSVYGVIRFCVQKAHDYLVTRKTIPPEIKTVEVRAMLDGLCIGSEVEPLIVQLRRIVGKNVGIKTEYIHRQSVNWLREAIDDKIAKDQKAT